MSDLDRLGVYQPLPGRIVEQLRDLSFRIVVSTEILLGLAQLPSVSLESLVSFAGDRMLMIPDAHKYIAVCVNGPRSDKIVIAAKRVRALTDHLPERDEAHFIPGSASQVRYLTAGLKDAWNGLPEPVRTSAVQQALVVLYGVEPTIAVSQCSRLFHNTKLKKPDRVFGVHHALAFLARHGHGISKDVAWADAITLTTLKPAIPFFGHPLDKGPVSDELRKAMSAYVDGSDDIEF